MEKKNCKQPSKLTVVSMILVFMLILSFSACNKRDILEKGKDENDLNQEEILQEESLQEGHIEEYVNGNYNFSINLPKEWENEYNVVLEEEGNSTRILFCMNSEEDIPEEHKEGLTNELISIHVYKDHKEGETKFQWFNEFVNAILLLDDDINYIFKTAPTDVKYNLKEGERYEKLMSYIYEFDFNPKRIEE